MSFWKAVQAAIMIQPDWWERRAKRKREENIARTLHGFDNLIGLSKNMEHKGLEKNMKEKKLRQFTENGKEN